MPHASCSLFHLLRGGWVCFGATGAWDAGGLERPGLIGLMPCPFEGPVVGKGTELGAKGNLGLRLPSGLMLGTGVVPGLIGKEGILGWLSELVGG